MSRDYRLGRVDLTIRAEMAAHHTSQRTRAQRAAQGLPAAGQDKRSADEFIAALEHETDRSLRRSPERWRTVTVGDLGAGRNLDNRKGRKLGPPSHREVTPSP